jgi:hypothetical protein
LLLNVSLPTFLLALGIYFGTVWKKNLDPVAGNVSSRAVLICYVFCGVLGLGVYFGASDRKEAEMAFVRRWADDLARKEVTAAGRDVEAGRKEMAGSRSGLERVNTTQEDGLIVQTNH